tara:strand:+ start:215 stop:673 length:459 start_codon:yes stop_codon:yes gene_type:complete
MLAIVGVMSYQGIQVSRLEERIGQLNTYIDKQNDQLDSLKNKIEDLESLTSQDPPEQETEVPWFWEALDYPESPRALIGSLEGQNQLIPFEGVLGGIPYFVLEEAQILDQTYVFVPIEDGHVMGGMILKYAFLGDSKIEWTVVDGWWPQEND